MKQIFIDVNKLPEYVTKRNESFRQIRHQALSTMAIVATNENMESLRKIAIIIYKIMLIQMYHALWTIYSKSGHGQLIHQTAEQGIYAVNLPIWPKEIKQMTKLAKIKGTDQGEVCTQVVQNTLNELNHQLKQYKAELDMKANTITNYSLIIQKMLEAYIEQHLRSFRMHIEHQIELVYHDYHIQALQLEYERHHPNAVQVRLYHS